MKKFIYATALLSIIGSACADEPYQLKAGLWNVKVVQQTMDGRDMTAQINSIQDQMQQAMAHMSPEQRQKMSSMMGNMMQGSGGGIKMCISPAMAERNAPMMGPHASDCPVAKVTRQGNQAIFDFACTHDGHSSSGHGTSTMQGGAISTTMDMHMSDTHGQHIMHMQSMMTYLGSDCQGVKPLDEMKQPSPQQN